MKEALKLQDLAPRLQRSCLLLSVFSLIAFFSMFSEVASAAEDIVFGCSTAMTGKLTVLGSSAYFGAKAYFGRLNRSGGINGRQINYKVLDDAYQPEKTLENIRTLAADQRVLGVVADLGTANALAVAPFLEKSNFPFLFPIAGSDRLRSPIARNIFLMLAESATETMTLLKYAHVTLKLDSIGVLSQSDGMGEGYRSGFLRSLHEMGLKPAVDEQYDRKTRRYDEALVKFLQVRPKAIYFGGTSDAVIPFVEQLAAKNYLPVLLFSSGVGTMQVLKSSIMKSKMAGVYATENVPLAILENLPLTRTFNEDLKADGVSTDRIELQYALEGYFAANVVGAALMSIKGAITRESLVDALRNLKSLNVGGVPVSLSSTNHLLFERVRIYNLLSGPSEIIPK